MSDEQLAAILTSEEIYDELMKLRGVGILNYVLPTVQLSGGEWVLGVPDLGIWKCKNNREAMAFITGANAVTRAVAKSQGLI